MAELEKPELIVKRVLEERGIQQKFICEKIKISQEQFSQCLKGKRKIKTVEFLAVCSSKSGKLYIKKSP